LVKISIVQGRLSSMVGNRYQYFPIHAWREEFKLASQIGFDGIEWVISDFSNPLFDEISINQIIELSSETGVEISSISLDVLMYNPIHKLPWDDVAWLFSGISNAVEKLGVSRVSIPIEENSGIRNVEDAKQVLLILSRVINEFGESMTSVCIETDLSVRNVYNLLNEPKLSEMGVLLDIGNAAANGYSIEEYFNLLSDKIYGVHIKDRGPLFIPNVPYGDGIAEIDYFLNHCSELPNLTSLTLQSYRSPDKYIENAKTAFIYVKNILNNG